MDFLRSQSGGGWRKYKSHDLVLEGSIRPMINRCPSSFITLLGKGPCSQSSHNVRVCVTRPSTRELEVWFQLVFDELMEYGYRCCCVQQSGDGHGFVGNVESSDAYLAVENVLDMEPAGFITQAVFESQAPVEVKIVAMYGVFTRFGAPSSELLEESGAHNGGVLSLAYALGQDFPREGVLLRDVFSPTEVEVEVTQRSLSDIEAGLSDNERWVMSYVGTQRRRYEPEHLPPVMWDLVSNFLTVKEVANMGTVSKGLLSTLTVESGHLDRRVTRSIYSHLIADLAKGKMVSAKGHQIGFVYSQKGYPDLGLYHVLAEDALSIRDLRRKVEDDDWLQTFSPAPYVPYIYADVSLPKLPDGLIRHSTHTCSCFGYLDMPANATDMEWRGYLYKMIMDRQRWRMVVDGFIAPVGWVDILIPSGDCVYRYVATKEGIEPPFVDLSTFNTDAGGMVFEQVD